MLVINKILTNVFVLIKRDELLSIMIKQTVVLFLSKTDNTLIINYTPP